MATYGISQAERDQLIADEFGVNADYVSDLLSQFERDPSSVDEEWRSFFDELLTNGRVYAQDQPGLSTVQPALSGGAETVPIRVSPGPIHATYDWGREGDGETRRRGDAETCIPASPRPRVSPSPGLHPCARATASRPRRAGPAAANAEWIASEPSALHSVS
jgi:hypothetical protein